MQYLLHSMRQEPLKPENGNPVHKYGIYSKAAEALNPNSYVKTKNISISSPYDNVFGIMNRVDEMKLDDPFFSMDETETETVDPVITQGDKLNQIKARRCNLTSNSATLNAPSNVLPTAQ